MLAWLRLVMLVLMASAAHGASTVETFEFPSEEVRARYQALIDEIRCPKCQNTNLSGSDAPIAKDLRGTVYRLVIVEGYDDDEVRAYLRDRYGDFVLYDPPFRWDTGFLWLAPLMALAIGVWILLRFLRREQAPLTEEEQARIRELLKAGDS